MNTRIAVLLFLIVLTAAGAVLFRVGQPEGKEPRVPRRQRLFEMPAELTEAKHSIHAGSLPMPAFHDEEGWRLAGSLQEPLATERADLRLEILEGSATPPLAIARPAVTVETHEITQLQQLGGSPRVPARDVMRLEGRRGGAYTILPIEPGAPYRFGGRAQAESLEPAGGEDFYGGTWYLAELSRFGTPEEVLGEGLRPVLRARHHFSTSEQPHDCVKTFRAGPESRGLLIAAVLGMPGEVASGSARFWLPWVERLSEQAFFAEEILDRRPASVRTAELEGDWRASRRVRFELGAETRPSIALLPGERLEWKVTLPEESAELQLGYAPWLGSSEARVPENETVVRVAVDGAPVLQESLAGGVPRLELRWIDRRIDLSAQAGRTVSLSLEVTGDRPAVVGAPIVRDRGRAAQKLNVLVISIDTLRADHVGVYGYDEDVTPHLDALAAEGIRFADVTAQAPYTLPSHVSMLSGQFPSVHGVQSAARAIAPARTPLLAEILAGAGYATRAFTAGGYLDPGFGFDRGFDAYSIVDPIRHAGSPHFETFIERHPDLLTAELVSEYGPERVPSWIRDHRDEPFFLFVHSYEVHDFDPPPGYLERLWQGEPPVEDFAPYLNHEYALEHGIEPEVLDYIVAHYDAALRHTDEVIGGWLALLDELGLSDRTIVAVTSDHGEELAERGVIAHSYTLYEEMIRVPMILRVPGLAPRVIDSPAMVIDLVPTLLGQLGLPIDGKMQGRDLLSGDTHTFVWSEVDEIAHKYALRSRDGRKVIHGPPSGGTVFQNSSPWEVFDLDADPGETDNLVEHDPEAAAHLRESLSKLRESFHRLGESLGDLGQGELDEKTAAQLRQLGYLKGK